MIYTKTLKYKDIHPENYGPQEINPGEQISSPRERFLEEIDD